jgi:hypothetical protein
MTSWSTRRWALVLPALLLTVSCVEAELGTANQRPLTATGTPDTGSQALFAFCPGGRDLCTFTPPDQWRPVWLREGDGFNIAYRELAAGLVLIKEQGHQASGSVFIVDPFARCLVRRDLLGDMEFTEEFGVRADGAVVLCSAKRTTGSESCDLWADFPGGKLTATTDFPEGCLWPRFLPDGSGVCWKRAERTLSIEDGPHDSRFKSYRIPLEISGTGLQEIYPLARDHVFLVVDNKIYSWSTAGLASVDTSPVIGSRQFGDRLYFTTCEGDAETPRRCHIWWTDTSLVVHHIRSSEYTPHRFQVLADRTVIVDEWGRGSRRIARGGPGVDVESILWSETGSVWQ